MRKFLFMLLAIFIVTACQNTEESSETETGGATDTEQATEENDSDEVNDESEGDEQSVESDDTEQLDDDEYITTKMDELNFYEIELDIEYANDVEYELEVERDDGRPYKAEIEDELNNVFLKHREAFDEIYPKIEQLSLTSSSEQIDVIEQVLDSFDLPSDYIKFEIEVKFHDGSELDFTVKQ